VTGRLVPSRDARIFADALIDILTNAETSERMSASALQNVTKFDMEVFVDRIESIYQTLVGSVDARESIGGHA
jgi:glycosyltransferase involved in cell wall biosynthesis